MSTANIIKRSRRDLVDIFKCAIGAVKPESLIERALSFAGSTIQVTDPSDKLASPLRYDLSQYNVHVLGGGKSVLGMATRLAQMAGSASVSHHFSAGCLSLPIGAKSNFDADPALGELLHSVGVSCHFGSENNLPDVGSVRATCSMLESISAACETDRLNKRQPLFIVLISGGGSACLTCPRGVDLDKKQQLIKFLVQKGANIVELNKVRRYFSQVKGGKLAASILASHPDSQVLTLILSDVIGDPIEFIASGPTFVEDFEQSNECHERTMLEILDKYSYPKEELMFVPQDVQTFLSLDVDRVRNVVIGSNRIAIAAAVDRARALGYAIQTLGCDLQGSTDQVVRRLKDSGKCGTLVMAGGETTVTKGLNEHWGLGGRAQEMALDYMIACLAEGGERGKRELVDMFMAGGTDGQDGPTDVAACIASFAEWSSDESKFNIEQAIEAKRLHNSYDFWSKHRPDWLVKTGLTGTNVMDLYMYLLVNK